MLYIHCFHWSTGTYGVFRCHVTEILQFMQLYLFSEWRWQMQMMNLRQQGHWLDWWAWTWCESRPRAFSQPHPNPTEHLWEIYLWRLPSSNCERANMFLERRRSSPELLPSEGQNWNLMVGPNAVVLYCYDAKWNRVTDFLQSVSLPTELRLWRINPNQGSYIFKYYMHYICRSEYHHCTFRRPETWF